MKGRQITRDIDDPAQCLSRPRQSMHRI
jgi:hypothetical protein